MAHIVIAYFLWLLGGWFGLHHFYLGRDRQAFIWWATWGGCFGLGWFRDLWRIPEYIYAANRDPGYIQEFKHRTRCYAVPTFGVVRFSGEIIMGFLFGILIRLPIPEEIAAEGVGKAVAILVPPLAVAVGVHLVANVQPHRASMKYPLIGAYIGLPWLLYDSQNLVYSALISAVFVNWKGKEWDLEAVRRPRKGICKRLSILAFVGTVYLILWGSAIYFNASVTTKDGEEIPLREAIPNFFNSPAWDDTKQTFKQLYDYWKVHGFSKIWEEIVEKLDPTGEANALKVLGLDDNATEKEIKAKYKELAKKYHPDRQKDPAKKEEAAEKFVEIQKAYETLSSIKSKRSRRNERSRRGSERDQDRWKYDS